MNTFSSAIIMHGPSYASTRNVRDIRLKVTKNLTHYVIQFSLISHSAYLCHAKIQIKFVLRKM